MAYSIYHQRISIGRHGVTLMEVLISIAVVAIGLLGVVALIPVGGQQAQTGARNDRKASVGRRSFREFKVRGMHSVNDNWLVWAPGLSPPQFAFPDADGDDDGAPDSLLFPFVFDFDGDLDFDIDDLIANPISVCIDPLGLRLAERQNTIVNAAILGYVPGDAATWFMPRVVTLNLVQGAATLGPACEELFIAQDDLVFEEPDDNAAPPLQTVVDGKRYAEGRYSWFATLVPVDPIGKTSGTTYRLSTAVVEERNTSQADEVILADTTLFPEVTLATASSNLRVGHWIMLAAKVPGTVAVPGVGEGNYGWYRIMSINDNVLTLSGLLLEPPAGAVVYAVVIRNVVNVYTKTIQIQP